MWQDDDVHELCIRVVWEESVMGGGNEGITNTFSQNSWSPFRIQTGDSQMQVTAEKLSQLF